MIDQSALLWRLKLRGVDVGDALARRWPIAGRRVADAGNYAFNDVHAMMAFVGADRRSDQQRVLDAQRAAMAGDGDNRDFTAEVGHAGDAGDPGLRPRRLRSLRRRCCGRCGRVRTASAAATRSAT